jgi:hypothetical protein
MNKPAKSSERFARQKESRDPSNEERIPGGAVARNNKHDVRLLPALPRPHMR